MQMATCSLCPQGQRKRKHWSLFFLTPSQRIPTHIPKAPPPNIIILGIMASMYELLGGGRHKTWRRQWHPTPVFLPGKSHGRRRLVGCSPWGRKESDTTERLHFHFSLSCDGEGNGNPLQCSCLENPRDSGVSSKDTLTDTPRNNV